MDTIHKIKVGIIGSSGNYANWITLPHEIVLLKSEKVSEEIVASLDLIIFTGGEDVSPNLYNEIPHITTSSNYVRDQFEVAMFNKFRRRQIPIIGICRGSQFVTVMSGGRLVQNVENHAIRGTHPLFIPGRTLPIAEITSTHHQMMYPFDTHFVPLLVSNKRSSFYNMNNQVTLKNFEYDYEPEIIYYPETGALGIQGHPEYMPHEEPIIALLNFYLAYVFSLSFTMPEISDEFKAQVEVLSIMIAHNVSRKTLRSRYFEKLAEDQAKRAQKIASGELLNSEFAVSVNGKGTSDTSVGKPTRFVNPFADAPIEDWFVEAKEDAHADGVNDEEDAPF